MTDPSSITSDARLPTERETEEKQVEFTPRPMAAVPDDLADLDLDN